MCGWNSANYMNQDSVCASASADILFVSDDGVELWFWGNHPCSYCKSLYWKVHCQFMRMLGERILYRGGCRTKAMMSIVLFYWCWSEVAKSLPGAQPSSSSGSELEAVFVPRQQAWARGGPWMVP